MSKKLSHEYVFNYYGDEKYVLNSIYKNSKNKDKITCPIGHNIEIRFNDFQQGVRCNICCIKICSEKRKHSQEYIYKYYKKFDYILKSIYKGNKNKDQLICPVGHETEMIFHNFQKGHRCNICYKENNICTNHPRFNHNREEIPLNKRLRQTREKDWIINNMKDDPNYEDFLNNQNNYELVHIIPISLFCEIYTKYNINESEIKNIINQRNNLQLLTWEENNKKSSNGSTLFNAVNYLINNGIDILKFEIDQ